MEEQPLQSPVQQTEPVQQAQQPQEPQHQQNNQQNPQSQQPTQAQQQQKLQQQRQQQTQQSPKQPSKLMIQLKEYWAKFRDFILECKRVLIVTRKPDKEEYTTIVKVSGIGLGLIGVIGFLVFFLKELIVK